MAQLFGVNNVGLLDPTDFFANSRAQSFFLDNTPQTALSAADKIVQNANQRSRRIRGEHNPKNIGITLNTNFPGMSQTTIPEDTPNLGNLNINPKQTAPAILAHEIGHVSQNHVRQANNIRRMYKGNYGSFAPVLSKLYQALDTDSDGKRDWSINSTDLLAAAGGSIYNGINSWRRLSRVVRDQARASAKAMRFLKGGVGFKPILNQAGLRQSKQLLNNALGTYKRLRLNTTVGSTAAPLLALLTVSGLGKMFDGNAK